MSARDLDAVCGRLKSDRFDTVLRKSDGKLRIVGITGQFPGLYWREQVAPLPRIAMAGTGSCETGGKAFPCVVHPTGEG
ncbi:hypothetical protein ASAP_2647 [Asaia bogorensis]|uniref:Uncharacterized protein n=1 Tax=Asaia bogorensis TaxID=91915 RepID=A0A060QLX1_9PROT|nr:hypothetical protein P792_06565 [Asaia sp. SF2.1]CDG40692.1 hypothetical protein ASAP_2647 [Asaia bogorensis]